MARVSLVAGNWKMNGTRDVARELARATASAFTEMRHDGLEVACIPPFPLLSATNEALHGSAVALGGQDVSPEPSGAFTGDVSAAMLHDAGCRFVLVGHSERRQYHGEDTPVLVRKIQRAREVGLIPIICVGEPLPVRQRGAQLEFVAEQVQGLFADLAQPSAPFDEWVLAYEPIWAIGTGEVATPAQAQEMCLELRHLLRALRPAWSERTILYGGSVKGDNAAELASQPDVDGFLVGGASLKAADFAAIMRHTAAAKRSS